MFVYRQEERQSLLLERITKSVHRLNEALLELDQSVVEINNHNQAITIVAELSEAVSSTESQVIISSYCPFIVLTFSLSFNLTGVNVLPEWHTVPTKCGIQLGKYGGG